MLYPVSYVQKPPLPVHINWEHPLSRGLVGCWLFNEGGGNIAFDLSGHVNHGTINGATWTAEKLGSALSFDGTNDYVEVPDPDQELAPDALTFAVWIKILSGWYVHDRIVTKKGSLSWDATSGWSLEIIDGGNMVFLGSGGEFEKLVMGWQENTWHFIAVTKEAGATVVKGYLNMRYDIP